MVTFGYDGRRRRLLRSAIRAALAGHRTTSVSATWNAGLVHCIDSMARDLHTDHSRFFVSCRLCMPGHKAQQGVQRRTHSRFDFRSRDRHARWAPSVFHLDGYCEGRARRSACTPIPYAQRVTVGRRSTHHTHLGCLLGYTLIFRSTLFSCPAPAVSRHGVAAVPLHRQEEVAKSSIPSTFRRIDLCITYRQWHSSCLS